MNSPHIDALQTTSELFILANEGKYVIYAPLRGVVLYANGRLASALTNLKTKGTSRCSLDEDLIGQLYGWGILELKKSPLEAPEPVLEEGFAPCGLIILATSMCNFRCRYCYASAGTRDKEFDKEVARAAIRLVIDNALSKGLEECNIAFHGGGEPAMAFAFIVDCVEYARCLAEDRIRILPSMATNGYMSEEQTDWFASNMYSIQVSMDGPATIQDDQRPLASGASSFEGVVRTVKRFEEAGVPHMIIKSTISSKYVSRMGEVARFLCESFGLDRYHLGPVMDAGRSLETGYCEPTSSEFLSGYNDACEVAQEYGKRMVCSLALETFPNIRHHYCGVSDPNFSITVEGKVTSCLEVIYADDPRSKAFHYGEYVPRDDSFRFDFEKIQELRNLHVTNLEGCKDCFARWHCAGDCQARLHDPITGESHCNMPDFRCEVNRDLLKTKLISTLKNSPDGPVFFNPEIAKDTF